MNLPVWLLDVDGVLNATRPGWSAAPRNGAAYGGGHPYRLRWAPALITRIRALPNAASVTLRWCSTWCADADQVYRRVRRLRSSPANSARSGLPETSGESF